MPHEIWPGMPQGYTPVQLIDTATAAVALRITESGVRKLGQRGVLRRYGTRRRQMWDLTAVSVLALKKVKKVS